MAPTSIAQTPAATTTPKPPKTQTTTLTAPSGERLRIIAKLHKPSGSGHRVHDAVQRQER